MAVFGTGFVVEDLEFRAFSFGLKAIHDDVVGCDTMAVIARLGFQDKDDVDIYLVGNHDLSVATAGADRELTHFISVDLANWLYPDMEFLGLDSGELNLYVRKQVYGDWLQWRLPLCVSDTLVGLREVSFEGLFRYRALFGGVGESESRPGRKFSSMYGCKPRGLDRKS